MNAPTILAAALLWTTMCLTVSQGGEPVERQEVEKLNWSLYVANLREEKGLDCYFTIECVVSMPGEERHRSPFDRSDLTPDPNIKTVGALLQKLRREMKGIVVIQNTKNPAIIHLIEEPLLKIDGYVMDKKVDIAYSGALDGLSSELEKHVPGIRPQRAGSLREMFGDSITQVKVDAKNKTVREVLTDYVPLENYWPVLWRAKTWKKNGQYKTVVRYHGLRRLPPKK